MVNPGRKTCVLLYFLAIGAGTGVLWSLWTALSRTKAHHYAEQGLSRLGWIHLLETYGRTLGEILILLLLAALFLGLYLLLSKTAARAFVGLIGMLAAFVGIPAAAFHLIVSRASTGELPFFCDDADSFGVFFSNALRTKFFDSGLFSEGWRLPFLLLMLATVCFGFGLLIQFLAGRLLLRKVEKPAEPRGEKSRGAVWALILLAAAVLSVPVAGAIASLAPEPNPGAPNVILVSLDTLRADYLGCYGNRAARTPNIDELASGGVLFETALSHSTWTLPGHASMVTGLTPSGCGVTGSDDILSPAVPTIAEILRNAGYETAGFVTHLFVSASYGFDQGFGEYTYVPSERAGDVAQLANQWLENRSDRPFFLFLHFYDPHWPYDPPAAYLPPDRPEHPDLKPMEDSRDYYDFLVRILRAPDALRRYMVGKYNGENTYADAELGRIFGKLDQLGIRENTYIIITADHGEEFYEHHFWGHAITLYDEVIRVPLIVSGPGVVNGRIDPRFQAKLSDVLPTVADLCGASAPGSPMGRSLVPVLRGRREGLEPTPVISETSIFGKDRWCVRHAGHKLITPYSLTYRDLSVDKPLELFDLESDPGEMVNIAPSDPELAGKLQALIDAYVELVGERGVREGRGKKELDPATREKLRSLGYI